MLNGETVTVHPYNGTARGGHGNTTGSFGPDRMVDGCGVDALYQTSEPDNPNRSQVIVGFTVFGPYNIAITAKDEVTVRGIRCTVQGDPAAGRMRNAFTGTELGCQFAVRRVEG